MNKTILAMIKATGGFGVLYGQMLKAMIYALGSGLVMYVCLYAMVIASDNGMLPKNAWNMELFNLAGTVIAFQGFVIATYLNQNRTVLQQGVFFVVFFSLVVSVSYQVTPYPVLSMLISASFVLIPVWIAAFFLWVSVRRSKTIPETSTP